MSMQFSYSCGCGWKSGVLDHAVDHANEKQHNVAISGHILPEEVRGATAIAPSAEQKARELEIMRQAKHRGLLKLVRTS